jgi:purine nucleosidase
MTDTHLILDVDTGIDDAMAILYALNRPGIRLDACTTTFGNTDVDTATGNTLRILELAGRGDVPVARGAARSLVRPYVKAADHVHGANGLGGVALPEPKARPVAEPASDLIIRMARENPGVITLCPVGPVTNVAIALTRAPEIAPSSGNRGHGGDLPARHQGIRRRWPTPISERRRSGADVLRSGARLTLVAWM